MKEQDMYTMLSSGGDLVNKQTESKKTSKDPQNTFDNQQRHRLAILPYSLQYNCLNTCLNV